MATLESDALAYHAEGRPGKIEVVPTKPVATQRDLSLAYSPGVAAPCMAIHHNPEEAFRYTARGNLVGYPEILRPALEVIGTSSSSLPSAPPTHPASCSPSWGMRRSSARFYWG